MRKYISEGSRRENYVVMITRFFLPPRIDSQERKLSNYWLWIRSGTRKLSPPRIIRAIHAKHDQFGCHFSLSASDYGSSNSKPYLTLVCGLVHICNAIKTAPYLDGILSTENWTENNEMRGRKLSSILIARRVSFFLRFKRARFFPDRRNAAEHDRVEHEECYHVIN